MHKVHYVASCEGLVSDVVQSCRQPCQKHQGKPLLLLISALDSLHYTKYETNSLMVKCLALGCKRQDQDKNPHSDNARAQFHKACKHKNLLSTEKYILSRKQVTSQHSIMFTLLPLVPRSVLAK